MVFSVVRDFLTFRFDDFGTLGLDRIERFVDGFDSLVRDQFGKLQGRQRLQTGADDGVEQDGERVRMAWVAAGGEQRSESLGESVGFEGQGAEVVAETGCILDPQVVREGLFGVTKETRLTFANGVQR